MRIGWACVVLIACGNQSQPATPEAARATATPSATAPATPGASASASATATEAASASASATETPPPAPLKTLAETLATAKSITLTWRPNLDAPDVKQMDINSAASIKAILDAVGPDQRPSGSGPGYMPTFDFKFFDKDGNPLATFSLFSSPTMSDSNKKYARINVADGTYGGVTVAKYEDLQKKLKALGVTLP